MSYIDEIREKLKEKEPENEPQFDDEEKVIKKPFYQRPLPKLILAFTSCVPLLIWGFNLTARGEKSVEIVEEDREQVYTAREVQAFIDRINKLNEELFESKSSVAFIAPKESIKKPEPKILEKVVAQKDPEKPDLPPPPSREPEKTHREYHFSSDRETSHRQKQKRKVIGAGVRSNSSRLNNYSSSTTGIRLSSQSPRSVPQINQRAEAALIQEKTLEKALAGQKVKAVLATPIVINGMGEIYNDTAISITLIESLKSTRGNILVAEQTDLLVAASQFGASSLVQLSLRAGPIPAKTVAITGADKAIAAEPMVKGRGDVMPSILADIAGIAGNVSGFDRIGRALQGVLRDRNRRTWNNYRDAEVLIVPAGVPLELKILKDVELAVVKRK